MTLRSSIAIFQEFPARFANGNAWKSPRLLGNSGISGCSRRTGVPSASAR